MTNLKPEEAIQRLVDHRNRLAIEVQVLQGKIEGLDAAVEILRKPGVAAEADNNRPVGAESVTDLLINLLEEAGSSGLNAKLAIEKAAERGFSLNQQSVSSLLSRLKRGGTLIYDRHRYRLQKAAPTPTGPMAAGQKARAA